MKGFKQWFEEYTIITEMAVDRKRAEQVVSNLGNPVFEHLVKVLYWKDEVNYNKHCNDINTWLFNIQNLELKLKPKRIPERDYYNWLYDYYHSSANQLSSIVNRNLKEYHSLPSNNITMDDLHNLLNKIYGFLAEDLSKDNFEDIKDYLPNKYK